MAKDDRLFAPFPIEMDEHPKIIGLSDAAFRAVIEGTFYSRRMLSDGFLDERVVLRKWGQAVADELSANDPERPSWVPVEHGWRIHDFEKHHPLRAEIEAKRASTSAVNREKGKRSGEARRTKAEQIEAQVEPDANQDRTEREPESNRTLTKSNSETETETETSTKDSSSELRPEVERLCILLRDLIVANGSKAPNIGPGWLTAARLMLVNDGRDPLAAERLMRWCQADGFWRGVVLSMPKFRTKYDELRLHAERERTARQQQNGRKSKGEQIDDVRELGRRMQEAEDGKAISA